MQSLCTLRNHCRQWPRNTRYQAGATPYLGRTCTGWIAPASPGAPEITEEERARSAPNSPLRVLRELRGETLVRLLAENRDAAQQAALGGVEIGARMQRAAI